MTTTSRSVATSIGMMTTSRSPTNFECLKWLSPVHSRNSNWPTSTGFSHWHSAIFAFVSPCPHRPVLASGRFANGHSLISSPLNFLNSCARVTGVKPLRVLARKSTYEVVVVARSQVDDSVALERNRAISVELQLVQPLRTIGERIGSLQQHGRDEASGRAPRSRSSRG